MYSGYYTFAMTKDGQTKDVHAKFTYIYRMTAQGVKAKKRSYFKPDKAERAMPSPATRAILTVFKAGESVSEPFLWTQ